MFSCIGASLGYVPALLTNIRLGWRGLPGKNILAYYKNLIYDIVSGARLELYKYEQK
jgi:hypothetical protein